ncbi:MAG: polyprenyl synthetase family protein [Bacteroidales bacterium]|nr:polyprenyl synthetase family protein [Bacteroidales bacterium]MBN2699197.1 polyprenyl synthetase family protein [Bacteroidales bacterium]
MLSLDEIRRPVAEEMKAFEKRFKNSISSSVPLVNIVINYILRRKGKQMRPLFVFLVSKMVGTITESTYTAASLIELLHTASLIHDDVVDESFERRGVFSINAIWKSKIAVLLGDYLLARGLLVSIHNREFELLEIVSDAVREMSEGELLQIQKARRLNIDMETYYEVIRKKTATLIASCTACGAKAASAGDEVVKSLYEIGINIGMAFQIKDDLFDYQPVGIIGKPTGNDIREKKFTLPLIYALNHCDAVEKRQMLRRIRTGKSNGKLVKEVVQFVDRNGGLQFADDKMQEFKSKAIAGLDLFPESDARTALKNLIEFTVSRKR